MAKKLLKTLIAVVALAAMFAGGYVVRATKPSAPPNGRRILYYVDPMHPAYKPHASRSAPDCGMRLEPVYADEGARTWTSGGKVLYYRDPQEHGYRSDKPGLNPETGNTLEPVYADAPQLSLPPGSIKISPER